MKDLRLKVVEGKHAGKEIAVQGKKFLIGRAEDCQLRPGSDLISRHHCVIMVEEGYIALRDFGSKNGTYINGDRVCGEQELKVGDRVKVGPLVFEVHWTHGLGGAKKPPVTDVKEAIARIAQASSSNIDVGQWLAPQPPGEVSPTAETQRIAFNEAESTKVGITQTGVYTPPPAAEPAAADAEKTSEKPAPAKPRFNQISAKDSQDAAAQMLAKLRKRR